MKVRDLTSNDVAALLSGSGLTIRTGPFVNRIVSDLPELTLHIQKLYADFPLLSDGLIDFHIRVRRQGGLYRRLRNQIVFTLDDEVAFYPYARRLALPLLEWGLNWCIYRNAHQFLIIHSCVVEKNGKAILIPGESGAGKSTLCAALVSRGWRLLSDELTLLTINDKKVMPTARPISLKNDSIQIIQSFAPSLEYGPETLKTPKGKMMHVKPPRQSVYEMDNLASPCFIVFPSWGAEKARTEIYPVEKSDAFYRVAECSINYPILGADAYNCLIDVVNTCGCFEIKYSILEDAISEIEELL
ncbi:MAG: HprK-related kinase A [Planctomycetota bacterium]